MWFGRFWGALVSHTQLGLYCELRCVRQRVWKPVANSTRGTQPLQLQLPSRIVATHLELWCGCVPETAPPTRTHLTQYWGYRRETKRVRIVAL